MRVKDSIAEWFYQKRGKGLQRWMTLILFLVFLVFGFYKGIKVYYHDSIYYWTVADTILTDGGLNLQAFPETFRGYLLPTLFSLIKNLTNTVLGSEIIGYRLFSSLLMSLLLGMILPYLTDIPIDTYRKAAGLLVCTGIALYFWGDFLQYPSSDMPAMVFMCGGTALLKYLLLHMGERKWDLLIALGCGGCLYAAYNTRAAYLYAVIVLGIYFLVKTIRAVVPGTTVSPDIIRGNKLTGYITVVLAITAGAALAAFPQMLINGQYTGVFTPRVMTEALFGYQKSLQSTQVFWGISSSRYETYVGSYAVYPSPGIGFPDTAGSLIMAREGITAENFTYLTLIKLFLKYPLDFCGIYAKHLVGLLTPFFGDSFVHEIFAPKTLRVFLIALLWITGGLGLVVSSKHWKTDNVIYLAALMVPGLLQMFGAPEIRFFIVIHFLFYFYLGCGMDVGELAAACKKYSVQIFPACMVIFFAWVTIVGGILQAATAEPLLIGDTPKQVIEQEVIYEATRELPSTDGEVGVEIIPLPSGSIASNTSYQISFEMSCTEMPDLLYLDFYGTNYDSWAQDFSFELEEGTHTYSCERVSGEVPEDAVVRLVYITNEPYVLKNLKIATISLDR